MTLIAVPRYAAQWAILSCGHVITIHPAYPAQTGSQCCCQQCFVRGNPPFRTAFENSLRPIVSIHRRPS